MSTAVQQSGHLSRHVRTAEVLETLDPAFAAVTEALVGHPYRSGVLAPAVRALVVLAVESVIPEADEPRIEAAVDAALADGATAAEVLCTFEIACSIGLHTVSVGLPVLLEEMKRAGLALPEETPRHRELQQRLETTVPGRVRSTRSTPAFCGWTRGTSKPGCGSSTCRGNARAYSTHR
ncbi:hypothetical protein ACIREM_15800 [Streptomyces shenzhenensis]|uniref:hypothetical protein n=1 Tax=Streptomyces shenzhenensis TaxID=943815 RepID=UPI0038101A17